MVDKNRLHDLYGALQGELVVKLESLRKANVNAEAKGDASERVWNDLLQGHVPHRYQVSKGFVIDADGAESHFIDVIIYDRQYQLLNASAELVTGALARSRSASPLGP
jgi:hypothetical protein